MKKKLYLLTGFLGAGKTSLLKHLLFDLKDHKVGVIQNEFGKVGIDGEILENEKIELTEINGGSIFCSCLQLSFAKALAEMGKRDVEYVVVESSGLADPSNVNTILDASKEFAGEDNYEFKGVICLIDAVNFLDQLEDEATVNRQLAHCHLAVINKVDLVDKDHLEKLKFAVREVNPICLIRESINGEIQSDFLEIDLLKYNWIEDEDSLNSADNKPKTISLRTNEVLTEKQLRSFLDIINDSTYRIKGFCKLTDGWKKVDAVEKLIDIVDSQERDYSELVFLSKVSLKIIRDVDNAWKKVVGLPMKLVN